MSDDITQLLKAWSNGDQDAAERAAALLYSELHKRAESLFRREAPSHTLQPTALINEAFAKLMTAEIEWNNRVHFYALASRMMRRLLINHAEASRAEKRGGNAVHVTLTDMSAGGAAQDEDVVRLVDALKDLEQHSARMAEIVQLKYFGGMTSEEISTATDLSTATIGRELRFARAWLKAHMSDNQ